MAGRPPTKNGRTEIVQTRISPEVKAKLRKKANKIMKNFPLSSYIARLCEQDVESERKSNGS